MFTSVRVQVEGTACRSNTICMVTEASSVEQLNFLKSKSTLELYRLLFIEKLWHLTLDNSVDTILLVQSYFLLNFVCNGLLKCLCRYHTEYVCNSLRKTLATNRWTYKQENTSPVISNSKIVRIHLTIFLFQTKSPYLDMKHIKNKDKVA